MVDFKDHFSTQSKIYSTYRPKYPSELFTFISNQCVNTNLAWDCATGTGQAARGLSEYFSNIIATDASDKQIRKADGPDNIQYRTATASCSGLDDQSVDLVSVAQALHWFELEDFYREVRRVLKPTGKIAVWSYGLMEINEQIDRLFLEFHNDFLGSYWPLERSHVVNGYEDLEFPFNKGVTPEISMDLSWSLEQFLGYLRTWSATTRYKKEKGHDPVDDWEDRFKEAWSGQDIKRVSWPITLLIGGH